MDKEKEENPLLELLRKHGRLQSGLLEICTIEKPVTLEELQAKLIAGVCDPKLCQPKEE